MPGSPRRKSPPGFRPLDAKWAVPVGGCLALLLSSCGGGGPSLLDPHGPAARHTAGLIWTLFISAGIICTTVTALLAWALIRRRRDAGDTAPLTATENRAIIVGGVAIPALILFAVFGVSLWTTGHLETAPTTPRLTVNVVARQWWWEAQYASEGFATANELHIPVGQSVQVKLTSDDVIHDFWVPQLQAKLDVFPGRTNTLWLQADEPGTYRGECAEFCGAQHANMNFVVVAEPSAQFETWLAAQRAPAAQPAAQAADILKGYQVFIGSSCSYCHAVKGTDAAGKFGPDLTHLASRQTLAAGTLPNTRGNLIAWIANTQSIKPGNRMPAFPLDAASMQYLATYLQSLQ